MAWNHNAFYYRWVLDQLPARVGRALDVGCGSGALTRLLASRAQTVVGIDIDARMIELARQRSAALANVEYVLGDVQQLASPADHGARYDVITAVSSLHHLPLRPALRQLQQLLAPNGTLAVVGCFSPDRLRDAPWLAAGFLGHHVSDLWRRCGELGGDPACTERMPVREPAEDFRTIRAAAVEILPSARLRRRMYFRYTLLWRAANFP